MIAVNARSVLRLLAGLHGLVEVALELPHPVAHEAEDVVEREPLQVPGVLREVVAEAVQLGKESLSLHARRIGPQGWS